MADNAFNFEVVGTIDHPFKGPPRHIAVSAEGDRFALVYENAGAWKFHSGPWTFETMDLCAHNIASGNDRAITWNDAQLCLATGHVALLMMVQRRKKTPPADLIPAGPDAPSPVPSGAGASPSTSVPEKTLL